MLISYPAIVYSYSYPAIVYRYDLCATDTHNRPHLRAHSKPLPGGPLGPFGFGYSRHFPAASAALAVGASASQRVAPACSHGIEAVYFLLRSTISFMTSL